MRGISTCLENSKITISSYFSSNRPCTCIKWRRSRKLCIILAVKSFKFFPVHLIIRSLQFPVCKCWLSISFALSKRVMCNYETETWAQINRPPRAFCLFCSTGSSFLMVKYVTCFSWSIGRSWSKHFWWVRMSPQEAYNTMAYFGKFLSSW